MCDGGGDLLGPVRQAPAVKLEGRLDQRDQQCSGGEAEPTQLAEGGGDGQVREIHDDHVNRLWDEPAIEGGQVGPLQVHHP